MHVGWRMRPPLVDLVRCWLRLPPAVPHSMPPSVGGMKPWARRWSSTSPSPHLAPDASSAVAPVASGTLATLPSRLKYVVWERRSNYFVRDADTETLVQLFPVLSTYADLNDTLAKHTWPTRPRRSPLIPRHQSCLEEPVQLFLWREAVDAPKSLEEAQERAREMTRRAVHRRNLFTAFELNTKTFCSLRTTRQLKQAFPRLPSGNLSRLFAMAAETFRKPKTPIRVSERGDSPEILLFVWRAGDPDAPRSSDDAISKMETNPSWLCTGTRYTVWEAFSNEFARGMAPSDVREKFNRPEVTGTSLATVSVPRRPKIAINGVSSSSTSPPSSYVAATSPNASSLADMHNSPSEKNSAGGDSTRFRLFVWQDLDTEAPRSVQDVHQRLAVDPGWLAKGGRGDSSIVRRGRVKGRQVRFTVWDVVSGQFFNNTDIKEIFEMYNLETNNVRTSSLYTAFYSASWPRRPKFAVNSSPSCQVPFRIYVWRNDDDDRPKSREEAERRFEFDAGWLTGGRLSDSSRSSTQNE